MSLDTANARPDGSSPLRVAADSYRQAQLADGQEVAAEQFLAACEHTTSVLGRLGAVFTPVKSDIEGNIHKLKTISREKGGTPTLQELVLEEKASGSAGVASDSLLWLKRAMQFMTVFLGRVAGGEEANAAAQSAYAGTLQKFHGFVVRRTFTMGLMAAPGTDAILGRLGGEDADEAQTLAELAEWVAAVSPVLVVLDAFLTSQGVDHGA